MNRTTTATVTGLALVLPATQAVAAGAATAAKTTAKAKPKVRTATRRFTGRLAYADRWGEVQVTIVVKKRTRIVKKKRHVTRRITSIKVPVYPDHTGRSLFISQQALPMLVQEALKAQSTRIYLISGATFTSDAFGQSLQSAILQSKRW